MSRPRILLRPAAERDLEQQAQYIAGSSGVDVARRFYRAAEQTYRLIAGRPGIGRPIPYRNPFLPRPGCFGEGVYETSDFLPPDQERHRNHSHHSFERWCRCCSKIGYSSEMAW
ncbi:MAG: type II toxin-antitoxin system RelE/ParE family toxin [Deltaproteobacteria bacterium]|nr:type II toxin-antitoxin system RelE/ParE family toxin [Deltaproteobacteria bacterium]